MPRYVVTLTNDEVQELKALVQKGGKGYRIHSCHPPAQKKHPVP